MGRTGKEEEHVLRESNNWSALQAGRQILDDLLSQVSLVKKHHMAVDVDKVPHADLLVYLQKGELKVSL
jgi:hypothetical protein